MFVSCHRAPPCSWNCVRIQCGHHTRSLALARCRHTICRTSTICAVPTAVGKVLKLAVREVDALCWLLSLLLLL